MTLPAPPGQRMAYDRDGTIPFGGLDYSPDGPGGTCVTITNAENGLSVAAIVGDRGPGTIAEVDLAYQTAAAIKMKGSGCVYVSRGMELAQ